jgi:hypothetical protein
MSRADARGSNKHRAAGQLRTAEISMFACAAADGMHDHLTGIFIKRCTSLIEQLPESWDGVYIMGRK